MVSVNMELSRLRDIQRVVQTAGLVEVRHRNKEGKFETIAVYLGRVVEVAPAFVEFYRCLDENQKPRDMVPIQTRYIDYVMPLIPKC